LETIFPTNHLIGAKTQSSQLITGMVPGNKTKQEPNYNTNNLSDAYKYLCTPSVARWIVHGRFPIRRY